MTILSAITGFFSSLPDIVKMVTSFMTWINHVSGNDPAGFIKTVGSAMDQLNNAKSIEERQDAAKAIADLVKGLG